MLAIVTPENNTSYINYLEGSMATPFETVHTLEELDMGKGAMEANSYPGHVLIMGRSVGGHLALQAYAIMGRSSGSRNRVFTQEGEAVRTVAPDKTPEQMAREENAALIYYRAMRAKDGLFVATNGAQTDPIFDRMRDGLPLDRAMAGLPTVRTEQFGAVRLSNFEPDAPNYTPRIGGVIDLRPDAATSFALSVVRRGENEEPITSIYEEPSGISEIPAGVGYGVQTYNGNAPEGEALPSFDQVPYKFPMSIDAISTLESIWSVLDSENRVALAVRQIDLETHATSTAIVNAQV